MPTTPEPAGRRTRFRKIGDTLRRSLSRSSSRAPSPSPPERDRDSDVASIKGSSKPSSLRLVDTAMLSPPGSGVHSVPSPIAESPAREAAAFTSDMFVAFSEKTLDPAITDGAAFIPAAPADIQQPVLSSASELTTMPEAPSQLATDTTNPSTEIRGSMDSPFIHVQARDVLAASASEEENSPPHSGTPIPETAPFVVRDSVENSTSGGNSKDEDSTKPSSHSLDVLAGLSNGNHDAGYGQGSSNGLIPTPTDLQPQNAASLSGNVKIPEILQPSTKERYEPITSMPLPAIQNFVGQNTSRNGLSAGSTVRPPNPARKPTDRRKSPNPRPGRTNSRKEESNNWLIIGAVVGAVGVLVFVLARK